MATEEATLQPIISVIDGNDGSLTGKIKCSICEKLFSSRNCLNTHLRLHTGETPFDCKECGKKFSRSDSLKSHIRNNHLERRTYGCHLCSFVSFDKKTYGRHIPKCQDSAMAELIEDGLPRDEAEEIITEPPPPPEEEASVKSPKIREEPKTVECPLCKKVMAKVSLRHHMETHTWVKRFKCDLCGKYFLRKSQLRAHALTHMSASEGRPRYDCKVCGKDLASNTSVKIHMRIHTGEKNFKCNYCEKCFSTNSKRVVHERTHTGEKPYHCQYCSKRFSFQGEFARHVKVAHEDPDRFACHLCLAVLSSAQSLKHHVGTHQKAHKCDKCNKSFNRYDLLLIHGMKAHKGDLPFKCTKCGKDFGTKANLDSHVQWSHPNADRLPDKLHKEIHEPEKLFQCQFCPKTCRSIGERNTHEKRAHGEKSFSCPTCAKRFTTFQQARKHADRVHSNVLHFKCYLCPKGVKHITHLRRHVFSCQNRAWANLVEDGLTHEEADEAVSAPLEPIEKSTRGRRRRRLHHWPLEPFQLKKCTVSLRKVFKLELDIKRGFRTWKIGRKALKPIR